MAGQQIDILFVAKYLGLSYDQILDVSIRRRQIVGQASGAVGDIFGFFENNHVEIRQLALGAAGCAHSGGICTDDDKIHFCSFPPCGALLDFSSA
jgi:hypothetical protein